MSGYVLSPRAVRTLRQLVRGSSDSTGSTYAPAAISVDEYALPWTVRWSASEASGNGAWCIWLPSLSGLVYYADAAIATIGGVSAAQTLTGGWYTITGASSNTTALYIVVTVTDATGAATAEVSTAAGSASSGETVYNIQLAALAYDSATGARSVRQYADSVITLGGEGGATLEPDDVSTNIIPDPPSGTQPDGDEGKLQVKGWKAGTPVSSYTVAQDIARDNADGNSVVVRSSSGTLEYKPIGTLAQLTGSALTGTKTVLTGLTWDTTNHTLVISSANVVYSKGIVTSWTANADGTIETTDISSIVGS